MQVFIAGCALGEYVDALRCFVKKKDVDLVSGVSGSAVAGQSKNEARRTRALDQR